jgi:hypothetical protein
LRTYIIKDGDEIQLEWDRKKLFDFDVRSPYLSDLSLSFEVFLMCSSLNFAGHCNVPKDGSQ